MGTNDPSPPRKVSFKAWWNSFSNGAGSTEPRHTVLGSPLIKSLKYASVQISTANANGELYVWGYIPVVVAKCGLYLKENATEVEGTFLVNGSAKRIQTLKAIFDTPPKYGKSLDWKTETYTTYDVANVLRDYFLQLPEPAIPHNLYDNFRDIIARQSSSQEEVISTYKTLIRSMPRANQYLLLYILDLFSVFSRKSDRNTMTAPRLATIFQPGIISHPKHKKLSHENDLNCKVLEFLIAQGDWFMLDTPAPQPPTSERKKSHHSSPRRTNTGPHGPMKSPSYANGRILGKEEGQITVMEALQDEVQYVTPTVVSIQSGKVRKEKQVMVPEPKREEVDPAILPVVDVRNKTRPQEHAIEKDLSSSWLFHHLFTVLLDQELSPEYKRSLQAMKASVSDFDYLLALSQAPDIRLRLLKVAADFSLSDDPRIREALQNDEKEICRVICDITAPDKYSAIDLEVDKAQNLVNLIQNLLDRKLFVSYRDQRLADRLLFRLSTACNILPTSLSITGVFIPKKEPIHGGGYADIYRGIHNGQDIALKRMRIFHGEEERLKIHQVIFREALTWQKIKHPYVLPFLGVEAFNFRPLFCLISPWMDNGTILRYIAENGRCNLRRHISEIAQGMAYLQSLNIIHGDLRGANILIDAEWHVRIADFGLAVLAEATIQSSHTAGAIRWMAPELLDPASLGLTRSLRTRESDVYSFACTCLELYTGLPPFSRVPKDVEVIFMVVRGERPELPADVESSIPREINRIVQSCWAQEPADRLPMARVVEVLASTSSYT